MATFTLDAVFADVHARVTQAALEVLSRPSDGSARATQAALEVLSRPSDGSARATQVVVEALTLPSDANVRITQSVVEVLVKQPIVGSKKADAVVKAHMSGSKTISAVIKATVTHGTRDVTYAYSGPAIQIYAGHTKTAVETTIPGCDLTIPVPVGAPVTIIWDVWQSHFQWAQDKQETLRLHRDGVAGLVLWSDDPQGMGTDAGNNKQGNQWRFTDWYREAAHSGRYSLSFLPVKGNPTLYSNSIYFSLQTPGVGPGMTLDAAIVMLRLKSFGLAARLRGSGTVVRATSIDAVIRLPRQTSTSIEAMLFIWGLGAFVVKAVVGRTHTSSFSLGAQITSHVESSFTVGALVRIPVAGSFGAGAVVRRPMGYAVAVDAVLLRAATGALTTSSMIARPGSGSFTVNAFLKLYSFRIDARIFVPATGALTVSAVIIGARSGTLAMGAVLARHGAGSLPLDAVILRSSFGIPGAFG